MLIDLVIFGTGGHAREALDVVNAINDVTPRYRFAGFLDDDTCMHGTQVRGHPVLGDKSWLDSAGPAVQYFIGVGSCPARARIARGLAPVANRAATLVHPGASVGSEVVLGVGSLVAPGVVVTTNVRLGAHTHLNASASVSHDCLLGDYVHVAPGARLAGNVRVGDGCDIGIGASIIQGLTVGEWSIVGAGAVVVRDVDANVTVAGVPAREIARRA